MAISLRGTVRTQEARPLEGAIVRLIGSEEPLGDVRAAAVHRPDAVSWDRIVTGYAGHRWNCWQRFVMNQVAGITWAEFRDQVIEHNPVLASDGYVYKSHRRYRLPQQVSEQPDVAWSRSLAGFSGNRWQCWETFVQGKVDGVTWNEFVDQVVTHNPTLRDDGHVFQAGKTYVLPENVQGPTEVTWTRMLTGFSGNRWQCWEAHVNHQVEGITWAEFMTAVVAQNPALAADGHVFKASKTYVLPENRVKPLYYLFAATDSQGRYAFEGLTTPGECELDVQAAGYHPHHERLSLQADVDHDVTVIAVGPRMVSLWEGYATASAPVRRLVDQALGLLGDDPAVYDSLSAGLQRLVTGYYYPDPNHFHHKDIVCADLVAICLQTAGVDLEWEVDVPVGTPFNTTHAANYYRPAADHPTLREVAEDEAWLPGDILIYWNGQLDAVTVNHVNMYVGPFAGTDLSGNDHAPAGNYSVVNASIDYLDPNGVEVGTAVRSVTKDYCVTRRFGYEHVQRMRHKDL